LRRWKGGREQRQPTKAARAAKGAREKHRPDLRVVQADKDRDGKPLYVNVGGMWKNVSKNGKEFYVLKIGQLKLLVFPNDRK
jgi:uncharacterized protein (DUF736 family)